MCLGILHGQGQSQKKALKKEYTTLCEKKTTLKAALCAARAIKTGFDSIADFWAENVVDDVPRRSNKMVIKRQRGDMKHHASAKSVVGIKVAHMDDILASDNKIGASREARCDAVRRRRRCDSHDRLYFDRFDTKIEVVRKDEDVEIFIPSSFKAWFIIDKK